MIKCKNFFPDLRSLSGFWCVASPALLTVLAGFAAPASGQQALNTSSLKAHSALNFTIVIPEILRILENSHPLTLQTSLEAPVSPISALQRIVVLSTMGKGFCMDMSLTQAHIANWKLRISGSAGSWLQQTASGYRLCVSRAGRYELALEHEFALESAGTAPINPVFGLGWPVNVSLATP